MEIRKKWLISFFVFLVAGALIDMLGVLNFKFKMMSSSSYQLGYMIGYVMGRCLIFRAIWGTITYHCAYRKRGTKWLALVLFVLPIGLIGSLGHLFSHNSVSMELLAINALLTMLLYGWFWVSCYLLRKENVSLNKQKNISL